MKVTVVVNGLSFNVPCGEGGQTFKWLGLVSAQRYALMMPHGRCRTREDAHAKVGFYVPAQVAELQTGEVMHPGNRLADHCNDGDSFEVMLQHEVTVDETGTPAVSPWAVTAFCHNEILQKRLMDNPVLEKSMAELEDCEDEEIPIEDRMESHSTEARIQAVMTGQLKSPAEIDAALNYDWEDMCVSEIEPDTKEQECIKDVFLDHFFDFISLFKHYAIGVPLDSYGMSSLEFSHFVHETNLLHLTRDAAMIQKVYDASIGSKDQTRNVDKLYRPCFFEACLRLAVVRDKVYGDEPVSSSMALANSVEKYFTPTVQRLTTGPFRDETHREEILTLVQSFHPKLIPLLDMKNNSISVSEISELIHNSGILCTGDPETHDAKLRQAVEKSFSGFEDTDQRIFVEFIEIVARMALDIWAEEDLPPREILSIAFEGIKSSQANLRKKTKPSDLEQASLALDEQL